MSPEGRLQLLRTRELGQDIKHNKKASHSPLRICIWILNHLRFHKIFAKLLSLKNLNACAKKVWPHYTLAIRLTQRDRTQRALLQYIFLRTLFICFLFGLIYQRKQFLVQCWLNCFEWEWHIILSNKPKCNDWLLKIMRHTHSK